MSNIRRSGLAFFLWTTAAWVFAVVIDLWLLDSSLVQSLPGGFIAIAVVGVFGVLIISLVQWALLEEAHFILWLIATGVGSGMGLMAIILANFIARMPLVSLTTAVPTLDYLMWVLFLFLLSALGSLPGGWIAGLLGRWSVGKGSVPRWTAVSITSWALSAGGAGVYLGVTDFFLKFYSGNFRSFSTLWRGAAFGVIIGSIQGALLGPFLGGLFQGKTPSNDSGTGPGWKRFLPVLFILPTIGCLLGYGFNAFRPPEQESSWESLGTPPSPAVRFVRVSPLIVSTENGEKYRHVSKDYGWEEAGDQTLDAPAESFVGECEGITPVPLEGAIDTTEICAKFEVGSFYRKFAILDDGSVWMWKEDNDAGFDGIYFALMGAGIFFVLGLVVVSLNVVVGHLRSEPRKSGMEP